LRAETDRQTNRHTDKRR